MLCLLWNTIYWDNLFTSLKSYIRIQDVHNIPNLPLNFWTNIYKQLSFLLCLCEQQMWILDIRIFHRYWCFFLPGGGEGLTMLTQQSVIQSLLSCTSFSRLQNHRTHSHVVFFNDSYYCLETAYKLVHPIKNVFT